MKRFTAVLTAVIFFVLLTANSASAAAIASSVQSVATSGGNKTVNIVTIDLNNPNIEFFPVLANNKVHTAASLFDVAEGHKTAGTVNIAAINGDYFAAYDGTNLPFGLSMKNGEMLHAGGIQAGAAFDTSYNYAAGLIQFEAMLTVTQPAGTEIKWPAWGVNHVFNAVGETVIYTTVYGSEVNRHDGVCAVVRNGKIEQIVHGNAPIYADGFTLYMKDCPSFSDKLSVGDHVGYEYKFINRETNQEMNWSGYGTMISGGPQVVKNGRILYNYAEQGFSEEKILTQKAQRSFLLITAEKKMLFGTVGNTSMSELGEVALALGATDAINLDGGASSGLYFNGKMMTSPGRLLTNVLIARESAQRIKVVYGGKHAVMQNEVLNISGRTYCPVRDIADILGLAITWDAKSRTVTVTDGDSETAYTVDSDVYLHGGEPVKMDAKPFIDANTGRTYLPVRYIAEPFGYHVRWEQAEQTIAID